MMKKRFDVLAAVEDVEDQNIVVFDAINDDVLTDGESTQARA